MVSTSKSEVSQTGSKKFSLLNLWLNPKIRAIIYQVLLVVFLFWLIEAMVGNVLVNMAERGLRSGFDFLFEESGFDIISAPIEYNNTSRYIDAFYVGVLNTLIVSVVSIFLATVIGFIVGISRLSPNWLVRNLATVYVELFRNIPLLLQIFLWYHATLKPLPSPRQFFNNGDQVWFSLTNSGLQMPKLTANAGAIYFYVAIIASILLWYSISVWARQRHIRRGLVFPSFRVGLAIIIILPVIAYLFSDPFGYSPAEMGRFRLSGGTVLIPEFIAMVVALSIYTASFIAEVVRAGLQSVSRHQIEAGRALGFTRIQSLHLIIIPQALRLIIPPLTNQYLNLTKNSSLAAAIAYPELVAIFAGTALNQSGRVFEILGMTLLVYLMFSLITAILMNLYNRKIKFVER